MPHNTIATDYQITVAFVITLERIMCTKVDDGAPFSISYTDVMRFIKKDDEQTKINKT